MRRLGVMLFAISIGILLLSALIVRPAAAAGGEIVHIEIRGPIFGPALEYLEIGLEQAEERKAVALLLELDTPGGSLDVTKSMVQAILGAPVPVLVYVSPSGGGAMSAGTFITLAAHVAAMAPGTTIGAAHPVMAFGGGGEPDEAMDKKIENYAISLIEAIAAERGRNVAWAAQAVRDSSAITSERALDTRVIDLVVPTREALLAAAHGREVKVRGEVRRLELEGATLREIEMTIEQRFYFFVSQPTVIFVLVVVALGGIWLEIQAPGVVVPGTVGVIALVLAAIGLSIVPVNASGAALMLLGIALLVAEIFVPSFGALGVGGLGCFLVGVLLLFRTVEAPGLTVDPGLVAATGLVLGGTMLAVGLVVARTFRRPVVTGPEGLIGQPGIVRHGLSPQGKVFVTGEIWNARLVDGGSAPSGVEIEVVAIDGLELVVARRRR